MFAIGFEVCFWGSLGVFFGDLCFLDFAGFGSFVWFPRYLVDFGVFGGLGSLPVLLRLAVW